MVVSLTERRAVLVASLGFLELRQQSPEVAPLRRWLDSWSGLGAVVVGMERHGYDLSLTRYPQGWRSTFLARDHTTRPWVGQVLSFRETPWRAVQHAVATGGRTPTTWPAALTLTLGLLIGQFVSVDLPEVGVSDSNQCCTVASVPQPRWQTPGTYY